MWYKDTRTHISVILGYEDAHSYAIMIFNTFIALGHANEVRRLVCVENNGVEVILSSAADDRNISGNPWSFIPHPWCLVPYPSSFILPWIFNLDLSTLILPWLLIPYPTFFLKLWFLLLHPTLILQPWFLIPRPALVPHPLSYLNPLTLIPHLLSYLNPSP